MSRTGRAVSPVVGVAVLIAITVLLAVTIGNLLFGFGVGPVGEPETTLSFEVENNATWLVHEGGDPIDAGEVVVTDTAGNELDPGITEDMVAGDRQKIISEAEMDNLDDDERITVVWKDPQSSGDQILATFRP